MNRYAIILLSALAIFSAPACFKCQDVLPRLVQAQSGLADAQRAMTQAQNLLNVANLPPEVKQELSSAIEKGWAGLHAASKAISAGAALCTETDVEAVFAEFNLAWKAIKVLIALFSVSSDGVRYGTSLGTPAVEVNIPDPIVFR